MVRRSLSPWLWGVLGGSHPVSLLAPEHQPRGPGILGSNLLGRRSKWFALLGQRRALCQPKYPHFHGHRGLWLMSVLPHTLLLVQAFFTFLRA